MAKKKRFYWLKLKNNFFADPKIKKIRKLAGGDTYTIIMLKIMLLTINDDGVLLFENIEDNLADELSLTIDEDTENIQATLIFMQKMKLIEELDDSRYLLPNVVGLIGSESDSAERVRKHREPKKEQASLQCNADVTQCNEIVTTEKRKDLDLKKEIKKDLDLDEKKVINSTMDDTQKFKEFREKIKKMYGGNGDKNFYPTLFWYKDLEIALNEKGHLYAKYKNEGFDKNEALKIWNYIYHHQDEIISLNQQSSQQELLICQNDNLDNEKICDDVKKLLKTNRF